MAGISMESFPLMDHQALSRRQGSLARSAACGSSWRGRRCGGVPFQEGNLGWPLAKFAGCCGDVYAECAADLAQVGVVRCWPGAGNLAVDLPCCVAFEAAHDVPLALAGNPAPPRTREPGRQALRRPMTRSTRGQQISCRGHKDLTQSGVACAKEQSSMSG